MLGPLKGGGNSLIETAVAIEDKSDGYVTAAGYLREVLDAFVAKHPEATQSS